MSVIFEYLVRKCEVVENFGGCCRGVGRSRVSYHKQGHARRPPRPHSRRARALCFAPSYGSASGAIPAAGRRHLRHARMSPDRPSSLLPVVVAILVTVAACREKPVPVEELYA